MDAFEARNGGWLAGSVGGWLAGWLGVLVFGLVNEGMTENDPGTSSLRKFPCRSVGSCSKPLCSVQNQQTFRGSNGKVKQSQIPVWGAHPPILAHTHTHLLPVLSGSTNLNFFQTRSTLAASSPYGWEHGNCTLSQQLAP